MKQVFKKIITAILTFEARLVLWKYKPHIVAVTGSVGKTSTKDALFTALSSSFFVRKSQKSFNTELGLPLTVLGCENAWNNPFLWLQNILKGLFIFLLPNHYPKWLILEVGLDRPGDIRRIVKWISCDVVVYTKLSRQPVHVEFFDSVEALLAEKQELVKSLKKDGTLVINNDDPIQNDFIHETANRITYGFQEGSAVKGSHVDTLYKENTPTGTTFRVDYGGASVPIELSGVLGNQHVYPVLAACAVGLSQDIHLVDISSGFTHHEYLPGRMKVLKGREGSIIIDDSYNASPIAVSAAIETLSDINVSGRKIFILGDMTELGKLTVEAHEKIGTHIAGVADLFIAVGHRMEAAVQSARKAGMDEEKIVLFSDSREAGEYVRDRLHRGDIVLCKGSQAMRIEKAVEKILAHPERAHELLVRQDKYWLNK